jgi:uncharacterized membrane protein (UPF0127 family)
LKPDTNASASRSLGVNAVLHTASGGHPFAIRIADRFLTRFCGLMLAAPLAQGHGLLLTGCASVHSAFMRQTIDVIYLDRHGCVIRRVSGLRPWRASAGWRAAHVLELAEGSIARYRIRPGDRLRHPGAPW